jgi:hypothetical protein
MHTNADCSLPNFCTWIPTIRPVEHWLSRSRAGNLKSFVQAVPEGKFNIVDMSPSGTGEWRKWNDSAYWGANFVWTTLDNFGGEYQVQKLIAVHTHTYTFTDSFLSLCALGTQPPADDGMKGNLSLVNDIPFAGMAPEADTR